MKNYTFVFKGNDLYWWGTSDEYENEIDKYENVFVNCVAKSYNMDEDTYEQYVSLRRKYDDYSYHRDEIDDVDFDNLYNQIRNIEEES